MELSWITSNFPVDSTLEKSVLNSIITTMIMRSNHSQID